MKERPKDRLLVPLLVPVGSLLAAAFVILGLSRILLAVQGLWATAIALAAALNVLTASALIAGAPRTRTRTLVGVMVAGSVLLGGGAVLAMSVSGELGELFGGREEVSAGEHPEREGPGETGDTGEEGAGETGTGTGEGESIGVGEAVTTEIAALDVAFDKPEITLPAGQETTIIFDNREALPHNVAIYPEAGGAPLFAGDIVTGPIQTEYVIPPLEAGTYRFRCDVHPNMTGTVTVA